MKLTEHNRVVLYFNLRFGLELVVLHAILSKLGRFLVQVWSLCGGLNKELSISVHRGPNSFWHVKRS